MHIDTLSIARDLKATELPPEQAEAIAAAIGRSVTEGAASKADLEQLRSTLELKLEQIRANLQTEIAQSRNQLLTGFISSQIAFAGLIIAAIKLL